MTNVSWGKKDYHQVKVIISVIKVLYKLFNFTSIKLFAYAYIIKWNIENNKTINGRQNRQKNVTSDKGDHKKSYTGLSELREGWIGGNCEVSLSETKNLRKRKIQDEMLFIKYIKIFVNPTSVHGKYFF